MAYDIRIEDIGNGKYVVRYKPLLDDLGDMIYFVTNSLDMLKREIGKRFAQIRQYRRGDLCDSVILVQPVNVFSARDAREYTADLVRAVRQVLEEPLVAQ